MTLFQEGQDVEVNKFSPRSDDLGWERAKIVRFDDRRVSHHGYYAALFPDLITVVVPASRIREIETD